MAIAFSPNGLPKAKYWGVWMESEGVWQCLYGVCVCQVDVWAGVGKCHINWDQLNKYRGIQILFFLPVASCRPNVGVSDGCLDGVWGCLAVSGWYLSVSGRCLGWVDVICSAKNTRKQHGWVKMTPKNTKKGQKTPKMPYFPRMPKDPSAIFFRQLFLNHTAQTIRTMYEPPMICFFLTWTSFCPTVPSFWKTAQLLFDKQQFYGSQFPYI